MKRREDFLGKELNVGDEVVFIRHGYRELMRAKIVRETAHYFIVSPLWAIESGSRLHEVRQKGFQLIKI